VLRVRKPEIELFRDAKDAAFLIVDPPP